MATTATKQLLTTVTSTGAKGDAQDSMIVSTASVDREGDRVFPSGMDATAFLRNPCLMWSHGAAEKYSALPIGSVTSLEVLATGIRAAWTWLEGDVFADRVRNAWRQGVIRAASIGFSPLKMTPNDYGGHDILTFSLLEISLCAIPANAEAVKRLKSLGLLTYQPALVRSPSPRLAITGDRSIPSWRLRSDSVVCRIVPGFTIDEGAIRAEVQRVVSEAIGAAAEVAIQRATDAARGKVQ